MSSPSAVYCGRRARGGSPGGTTVNSRATRIALEANAKPRRIPNARSARVRAVFLRDTPERRAMRCVDAVELGAERGEGGVAELRNQATRQVARKARAMLRARKRGPVDVGLTVAHALEEAFLVEPDHDRHHRRVGELPRAGELHDDVADGRRATLPEPVHDLGLERAEELLLGLLGPPQSPQVRPSHGSIIPRPGPGR